MGTSCTTLWEQTYLCSATFQSQENDVPSAQQGMVSKEPLEGMNGWTGFNQPSVAVVISTLSQKQGKCSITIYLLPKDYFVILLFNYIYFT